MVDLDGQVTVVSVGFLLLVLLTTYGGFSYHDLLGWLANGITKPFTGVDFHGMDTLFIVSLVILGFESVWSSIGGVVSGLLVVGLVWFLSNIAH